MDEIGCFVDYVEIDFLLDWVAVSHVWRLVCYPLFYVCVTFVFLDDVSDFDDKWLNFVFGRNQIVGSLLVFPPSCSGKSEEHRICRNDVCCFRFIVFDNKLNSWSQDGLSSDCVFAAPGSHVDLFLTFIHRFYLFSNPQSFVKLFILLHLIIVFYKSI